MTFKVNRPWGDDFPPISKPTVLGYYSLNDDRNIHENLSQLKYYVHPNERNVSFDLRKGYENVIHKSSEADDEKLDHILHWILSNVNRVTSENSSTQWLNVNFVCFRGLLTKLWCTPFEKRSGWCIVAAKFRGTIYLCAFDTPEDKKEKENRTERNQQFSSWGFKFEQYMLSDDPGKKPDTTQPVNEAEEFACVFGTEFGEKFGKHHLLYAAEMDGVVSRVKLSDTVDWTKIDFIELKTSRSINTYHQEKNFLQKILKWWCQSFLVGVEKIHCGFRNDDGIVSEVKTYKVKDLVQMAEKFWQPSEAMNFCDVFLDHVKKTVREDCDNCVYKFTWNPNSSNQSIQVEKVKGKSEFSFLPEWYTNAAKGL